MKLGRRARTSRVPAGVAVVVVAVALAAGEIINAGNLPADNPPAFRKAIDCWLGRVLRPSGPRFEWFHTVVSCPT